jgi:arylformamidase
MEQKLIDISRAISNEAVVYPGDDNISHHPLYEINNEVSCNITILGNWTTHFLTHVDPPLHFIKNGKSLDDIDLNRFYGKVKVVEINSDSIKSHHLTELNLEPEMTVFFKTKNSEIRTTSPFYDKYVYISKEAAELMVNIGLNMVGIDYISVDKYEDEDYPAHRTLLGGNVLILEGIILDQVKPGDYLFYAFPLKITNGNGSPVRALLKEIC